MVIKLDAEAIKRLVAGGESQTVEFKTAGENQIGIGELFATFANTDGGVLLMGVSDDGKIVGLTDLAAAELKVRGAARNTQPSLDDRIAVYRVVVDNKEILVAEVPTVYDAAYSYSSVWRERRGATNVYMSDRAVADLLLRRTGYDYDQQPLAQLDANALDADAVNQMMTGRLRLGELMGQRNLAQPEPYPSASANKFLLTEKALRKVEEQLHPTVAGLLALGHSPQVTMPEAMIQCARFRGTTSTHFLARAEYGGTVQQQLDEAVAFIARNTSLEARIVGTRRVDIPAYPTEVVREAIANALLHRDYRRRGSISVNIYDDRLEVISPGGLLPGLRLNDLEGSSELRNRALGFLMMWLRLVERWGTGITRMRDIMVKAGLPEPLLQSSDSRFRVLLYSSPVEVQSVEPLDQPVSKRTGGLVSRGSALNARQMELLAEFNRQGGMITAKEYVDRFHVSRATASRDLGELTDRGLLLQVGQSRETTFTLMPARDASDDLQPD